MNSGAGHPILVGVDGSPDSVRAARWAVDEARRRDCPVQLVYVYSWPPPALPMLPLPTASAEELRRGADDLVARVAAEVAGDGAVVVAATAAPGVPAHKLIELSERAQLVVLGHRGHEGFTALHLGSVAATVAAHAVCPVAVVRPNADGEVPSAGPVLVGVDGSKHTEAALRFAFEEARLREAGLAVLYSWEPPALPWLQPVWQDEGDLTPDAREAGRLRGWIEPWQAKYPEVPVTQRVVGSRPAAALVEAARGASLVVVGMRGHGGFVGLLLGSVSQQVLQHAPCPVVIAR